MDIPHAVKDDRKEWLSRLRKIEGQVRGLQNMVEKNRSGSELIMQIASVKSALHQLAVKVFETYLHEEFSMQISEDNTAPYDKQVKEMLAVLSRSFK